MLVVHFRNGLSEKYGQAVTMHPHGVKYNPEYDGVYLGAFTRAGGFIEPGEEFTYTWEVTPDSVGVWPYHDHGPNHTLNTFRGLFGGIVIRERGDPSQRLTDDLVLGGEVVGGRRQRHARLGRDRSMRHGSGPAAADQPDRRRQDRLADGLGRFAVARRGRRRLQDVRRRLAVHLY